MFHHPLGQQQVASCTVAKHPLPLILKFTGLGFDGVYIDHSSFYCRRLKGHAAARTTVRPANKQTNLLHNITSPLHHNLYELIIDSKRNQLSRCEHHSYSFNNSSLLYNPFLYQLIQFTICDHVRLLWMCLYPILLAPGLPHLYVCTWLYGCMYVCFMFNII